MTKEETIEVKLNYKLMAIPSKKDYMYDIFPKIMGKVNRADLGFHISGPYCYGTCKENPSLIANLLCTITHSIFTLTYIFRR